MAIGLILTTYYLFIFYFFLYLYMFCQMCSIGTRFYCSKLLLLLLYIMDSDSYLFRSLSFKFVIHKKT
jgi:hypothetical protein